MTLVATHALVGSPPLDDEVPIQASQHDLADLDPELPTGFDAPGVDLLTDVRVEHGGDTLGQDV